MLEAYSVIAGVVASTPDSALFALPERIAKGYDFAREVHMQLIALSTGVLALSVTFLKDVVRHAPARLTPLLMASWASHFGAIGLGMAALMSLTGELVPVVVRLDSGKLRLAGDAARELTRVEGIPHWARIFGGAQVVVFLFGVLLFCVYGFLALTEGQIPAGKEQQPTAAAPTPSDSPASRPLEVTRT